MSLFLFNSQIKIESIKKVLIIHPFGLGDALLITPLIQTLKENGIEQIDLLIGSRTREIFEHNPNVHHIYEWDKSSLDQFSEKVVRFFAQLGMFFKLWSERYQIVFDLTPRAQYAAHSLFLFWIPKRIGFNFKNRGFLLTHQIQLPNGFVQKSVCEYYLDLPQFLNIKPNRALSRLDLSSQDEVEAEQILNQFQIGKSRFLAIAPGGGESWGKDARLKQWPVSHFSELIKEIKHEQNIQHVFIFGSKKEYELCESLKESLKSPNSYNLAGKTSIRVAAALIQKAELFIGNDGGLVHLAHAMKTPLVGIYGPVDPIVYGPYPRTNKTLLISHTGLFCRPCYRRFKYQASCQGVECLSQVSPKEVIERMRQAHFFEHRMVKAV